jgi:hypothetical protein
MNKLSPAMLRMLRSVSGTERGLARISEDGTLTLSIEGVKVGSVATAEALVKRGLLSRDGRWTYRISGRGRVAAELA